METNHFENSERIERERIKELYFNYFNKNNCNSFLLTAEKEFSPIDAVIISANTKSIAVEHKTRNISIRRYSDCLIELHKYKSLYHFHQAGFTAYYLITYTEGNLTAVFNLSNLFRFEQDELGHPIGEDGFVWWNCTANMSDYQHGQKEKQIRFLPFYSAEYFITGDYNKITYKEFNNNY